VKKRIDVEEENHMTQRTDFTITAELKASPEVVIYAFSTAQGWRDWLCDSCRFRARSGSGYFFGWDEGWYTCGTVESVEKPDGLTMSWRGKDDPGSTHIAIILKPTPTGTEVTLNHSGFGDEENWRTAFEDTKKGWETGFDNLVSIFDSGEDLRQTRRPMLGIIPNDFNEKIAAEIGVPVTEGVRIDQPVQGMGAEKAGLMGDDVIVEMNGIAIRGFEDLNIALGGLHAGESTEVVAYRGHERQTFEMKLSKRPTAEAPRSLEEFAAYLETIKADVTAELRQVLNGVSEEQAGFSPGGDVWSVKESLAHLIDTENFSVSWITELMSDAEREFTGEGENQISRLRAMLEVTPTVPELLDRYEKAQREHVAMIRGAEPLMQRKAILWKLAQFDLLYPGTHERGHIEQIKNALQAAQAAGL
jgi:uncharacterized protein YndB with AHSA1/START domain